MVERHAMSERAIVTAEELEKIARDDSRYELVAGRLVRMTPVGWQHGRIVARLVATLSGSADADDDGAVVTEVGFKLASDPDTVRAPDVAFVRRERIPPVDPRGFWDGPPDLAVEVLSPDDRPSEIQAKTDEYLRHGVMVVVLVNPGERAVSVFRRSAPPLVLRGPDAVLELGDLVPTFSCTLRQIFTS